MAATVHLDRRGLVFDDTGEHLPLYSGAVHYWRLDPDLWRPILERVRELGFRCIETYVPWSVHETAPGTFDFSGQRDVEAFVRLCADLGLYVIARPGPHINSEITYYGYPERVVLDPALQACTADGAPAVLAVLPTPFPIPSYAAPAFYEAVAVWYDAVCPILARLQYPHGPVVLLQVDNELSYFFKLTPYDVDYHPAARAQYRDLLRRRYDTIGALNEAYGTRYGGFEDVEPPADFTAQAAADLPRYLDWAAYREHYITDGLARLAEMLRARGIDRVPLFHNVPREHRVVPFDQVRVEQLLDLQGIDSYHYAEEYDTLKRISLYLAGTSRLPFIPEFGAGTWLAGRVITELDAETSALCALMHGVRAFNYYMIVERERWLGCAIGRRGDVREPEAAFFRRLLGFLDTTSWQDLERRTDVLLLYGRDYERHAFAAQLFSPPIFPYFLGAFAGLGDPDVFAERDLGLGRVVPRALRQWWNGCYAALTAGHYGFVLGDTESDPAALGAYRVVVCPGFAYMSRSTQERLAAYVRAGGNLIIGPDVPTLDDRLQPCNVLRQARAQRLQVLEQGGGIGSMLAGLGILPAAHLDNPEVDTAVFTAPGRVLIFVANTTDSAQTYTLTLPGTRSLRGVWQDGTVTGDGSFAGSLAPRRIQIWEAR